jgi:hypothetical protein
MWNILRKFSIYLLLLVKIFLDVTQTLQLLYSHQHLQEKIDDKRND